MTHLTEPQFTALLSGRLTSAEEESCLAHVETCDLCLTQFEALSQPSPGTLKTAEGSGGFHSQLMQRINRERTGHALLRFLLVGVSELLSVSWKSVHAIPNQKDHPDSR